MLLVLADFSFNDVRGGGPAVSLRNLLNRIDVDARFLFSNGKNECGMKWSITQLIRELKIADTIYCNSLFSLKSGILPLILAIIFSRKVIVAPRGELLKGKIQKKFIKKILYLKLFSWLYKLSNVTMHYTSTQEKVESNEILGDVKYFCAINLVKETFPRSVGRKSGKVIWFSRISKEKNLVQAIEIFKACELPLEFHIYGPVGDKEYFREVMLLSKDDRRITYKGSIDRKCLQNTLSRYDLFLFPTLAENYGHVIVEAIQSGLYVLSGNNIPFDFSGLRKCGQALEIEKSSAFVQGLYKYYSSDPDKVSWELFLDSLYARQEKDLLVYKKVFS
jgi:glycosyltransferase involved in cell wall biosynthesis